METLRAFFPQAVLARITALLVSKNEGPTLAAFGIAGAQNDPKLTVFSGQTAIATNDKTWNGTFLFRSDRRDIAGRRIPIGQRQPRCGDSATG